MKIKLIIAFFSSLFFSACLVNTSSKKLDKKPYTREETMAKLDSIEKKYPHINNLAFAEATMNKFLNLDRVAQDSFMAKFDAHLREKQKANLAYAEFQRKESQKDSILFARFTELRRGKHLGNNLYDRKALSIDEAIEFYSIYVETDLLTMSDSHRKSMQDSLNYFRQLKSKKE